MKAFSLEFDQVPRLNHRLSLSSDLLIQLIFVDHLHRL